MEPIGLPYNHFYIDPEPYYPYEEFEQKAIATSRFKRNHLLMKIIFSGSVVPSYFPIVTAEILSGKKKQIQAMEASQRKILLEIQDIKKRFIEKRLDIIKRRHQFEKSYKESHQIITKEMFLKMINKNYEYLKQMEIDKINAQKLAEEEKKPKEEENEKEDIDIAAENLKNQNIENKTTMEFE